MIVKKSIKYKESKYKRVHIDYFEPKTICYKYMCKYRVGFGRNMSEDYMCSEWLEVIEYTCNLTRKINPDSKYLEYLKNYYYARWCLRVRDSLGN